MEMEGAKKTLLKVMAVVLIMAAMMFVSVSAGNITVGGSTCWDLSTNLTHWSYSTPIFVNDSLLFIYTPAHDVIEVSESDFTSCNPTSPIGAYNNANGETLITLSQPGPRYFVCGRDDHCSLGLKVRVQVLDRPQAHDQPNASTPNYPANRTNSDDYEYERGHDQAQSSSAGLRDVGVVLVWGGGRFILTVCLYAVFLANHPLRILPF